jgi:L-seryl-tRNA(Ser) seleniumtransferase
VPDAAVAALPASAASLRPVVNATGVLLHTNLGRAPLSAAARAAVEQAAGCTDVEFDLATGRRDRRGRGTLAALAAACPAAEAVHVVNNNAAALVLALAAHAQGREVIVSRGELVEIGGSFRIPEILATAGARLVEVGATNRTRLADYRKAIGPDTAFLLKVFPSNFRQTGFVAAVDPRELAELGRETGIPVLVDEGSGLLYHRLLHGQAAPQLAGHPSMSELIEAGCDLVCGSGDKLLGGPQAGILVGRAPLVAACRKHPLYRALRPDRTTFAALEGVLRLHRAGHPLPLDRLWPDPAEHRARLVRAAAEIGAGEIVPADAFLGGGSAPEEPVPGEALALPGDDALLARLRKGDPPHPPVIGYLRQGRLILDFRTVDPEDDPLLTAAVRRALL